MKKVNYHTHTFYCGHAFGDEEAMIDSAIKSGYQELGFSEHVPLPHYRWHLFKALFTTLNDYQSLKECLLTIYRDGPNMRMSYRYQYRHWQTVKNLKQKYQNQIKIYQGFEAEYLTEYLDYYQEMLASGQIDYLILGHHFDRYCVHNHYNGRYGIRPTDIYRYRDDVIAAIKSNLFSYIAHPDIFMIGQMFWNDVCEEVAYDICRCAKQHHLPLEINGGGIRRGLRKVGDEMEYPYPNSHFFDVASKVGNEVIIGMDAHSPTNFNDNSYEKLLTFAKKHQLKVVDEFTFRKGKCI